LFFCRRPLKWASADNDPPTDLRLLRIEIRQDKLIDLAFCITSLTLLSRTPVR
jgi:hypothetical protein